VFHLDDGWYAIEDVCTHDGGPVAEGRLEDGVLECPRHGATFDLKTGAALSFPAVSPVPTHPVRVVGGDVQVAWFWSAGLLLVIVLVLAQVLEWRRVRDGLGTTAFAALLVMTIIYLCQVAGQVTFHTLALTPERFIFTVVGSLLLFPFWLSFEFMLRRGGLVVSTIRAAIGRALIIAMLVVGIFLQVLPGVLMLILPTLVLIYVTVEILAAAAYSSSRNLMLIALVESMWLTWTIAATAPITFML